MASPQILFGNRQQQKSHVDLGTVQDCVGMGQSALKNNNVAKKASTWISACLNFTFLQISENSMAAVLAMSDIIFSGHRRTAGI